MMNRIWTLLLLGCLTGVVLYTVIILQQSSGSFFIQKHLFDTIDITKLRHNHNHNNDHEHQIHSKRLSVNTILPTIRTPNLQAELSSFVPTRDKLFPNDPDFKEYEIGDCVNNGDSYMKKLSRNCGCPPEKVPSDLHQCCRLHMLKMLKDVWSEMIKADVPFILKHQSVKNWLHGQKLSSSALDISAGLPYSHWYSDAYLSVLKRLASRGYCVWFRDPTWTKIWSSVIPVDIRPWSVVGTDVYFEGDDPGNPYPLSSIVPKRMGVLDGISVLLPNKPRLYLDKLNGVSRGNFVPTKEHLFPPAPSFESREEGQCVTNGASELKNLPTTCGCKPEKAKGHNIHSCCRKHLLKLIKAIYTEMVAADIPMLITGGAVIGWYRNKKLVPYDHDIDGGLEYKYWNSPKYVAILKRLAAQGFCVWYRTPTWTKIWSTVVAFDLFAFNVVDGKEVIFDGPLENGPYNVSHILPAKLDIIEGIPVYLPQEPDKYMDQLYGKGNWIKPLH